MTKFMTKKNDPKAERVFNGNRFSIYPFYAFTAANLSGEISSLVIPILASIAPAAGKAADGVSLLDINVYDAAPALASGLSAISGDRIENLLKNLLVKHGNISVELEGEDEAQLLTEDLANNLFCGDAHDMFILAFDVIKVNFSGFFVKLASLYGGAIEKLLQKTQPGSQNTAS